MHALRNVCSLDPSLMHLRNASRAILFCALYVLANVTQIIDVGGGWRVVAGSGWWVGCCIATPNQPTTDSSARGQLFFSRLGLQPRVSAILHKDDEG